MSEISIHVDWYESDEKWEQVGQKVMREYYESHPKALKDEGYEKADDDAIYEILDRYYPMMNYAYPLQTVPSDDAVLKVCQETNCTVVYNAEEEEYYLALTGGGMNLSQDIAYAYQIIENWIPVALLQEVSTQPELSIHGTKWLKLARQIRRQEMMEIKQLQNSRKEWANQITRFIKERKERNANRKR